MNLVYNIYFGVSAMIFMAILAVYLKLGYNMQSVRNREFYRLVMTVLGADVMDVITAITISYPAEVPPILNLLLNTGYFYCNAALCYSFYRYALLYNSKFEHSVKPHWLYTMLMTIHIIVLTLNMLTGWVFSFDEGGNYVHGPIYFFIYVIPYFMFISGVFVMFINMKDYSAKQRYSTITFAVVGTSGGVLQIFFFPDVLLTMFTISVAIIIVLFSLETPEYQQLMQTMEELRVATEEAEEAKKKAEVANQTKSSFLANMSHEIRTPINAVLGMNEMILRESTEKSILEYANNIQSAGNGLLSLINDILDISKIESGKMELIPVEYNLFKLLKDCYNMIDVQMKTKYLKFVVECDSKIPEILFGDELRVRQILFNLLTNAYKYTQEGTVTLRVKYKNISEEEILLVISVEDTGIGISIDEQKHLFESFERVDKKRNRNIEGSGLGLAITKQLVELMHGDIGVISTLGEGSLFYVEIPQKIVTKKPVGDFYERYNESIDNKKYCEKWCAPKARILIVDDVEANLMVASGLLKDTKAQIDEATSGFECLELTKKNKYHVILLDHMMPVMDGIETLQKIREQDGMNQDTPVVALTANAISGVEQEYLNAGFSAYLPKPVTRMELEQMVLKFLPEELVEEIEGACL